MQEFEIHGKTVTIHKFGAIEGWKLLHKIMATIGPAMGAASRRDYPQAVSLIFNKFDQKDMIDLMKQCLEVCLIDGAKTEFGKDMKDYAFGFDLVSQVLKYNFEEFFFQIRDRIKDMLATNETTRP